MADASGSGRDYRTAFFLLLLAGSLLGNALLLSQLVVSRGEYNLSVNEINRRLTNIETVLGMYQPRQR